MGISLAQTVGTATEALSRQRFVGTVTSQLESLRQDPEAWTEYLAEAETTSVSDGIAPN